MTIEQTRQKVKTYYDQHTELLKQIEKAKQTTNKNQLKQLNREFSNLVKFRPNIYRGWALEEAIEVLMMKMNQDDTVKHLQSCLDLITSTKEKHKFLNEFLAYAYTSNDDTKEQIKAKLTV